MNNLKMLRNERGVTQQALADAIGTNQQAINGYENRGIEPDFEMLIKLADYFNTSIDYLLGRTESRCFNIKDKSFVINSDEIEMIKRYRRLSTDVQRNIAGLISGYTK